MILLAIRALRFKFLQNFIPRFMKHGKIGTSFIGGAAIESFIGFIDGKVRKHLRCGFFQTFTKQNAATKQTR
jgi:hypothetical protein